MSDQDRIEFEQDMELLFDILLDKAKEGKISYDDIEDKFFGPIMDKTT